MLVIFLVQYSICPAVPVSLSFQQHKYSIKYNAIIIVYSHPVLCWTLQSHSNTGYQKHKFTYKDL